MDLVCAHLVCKVHQDSIFCMRSDLLGDLLYQPYVHFGNVGLNITRAFKVVICEGTISGQVRGRIYKSVIPLFLHT